MTTPYVKRRKPLRGGWDTDPEEYKSMGFTIGMPPNLYIPQTKGIIEVSRRFESADSSFLEIDSNFSVQERQTLFQSGHSVRCFVGSLPPNIDEKRLKNMINQTLYKRHMTSSPEVVSKVLINPHGQFAFIDFDKNKDAEKFIELKDSFDIDGYTVRIRRSNMTGFSDQNPNVVPSERPHCMIINDIGHLVSKKDIDDLYANIKDIISRYADVERIQIPKIGDVTLGYMLIDLVDTSLVDYVCLKLQHGFSIDCRRCFARYSDETRDPMSSEKLEHIRYYGEHERDHFAVFSPKTDSVITIADVLNLDIDITKIETVLPPSVGSVLRIFNVSNSRDQKELEVVRADMHEECAFFGKVLESYVDHVFDCLVEHVYPPINVRFESPNDAKKAQIGISGRKYCGRIVITSIDE